MNKELVTLAIHSLGKAAVLKEMLEQRGIIVVMEKLTTAGEANQASDSYVVKIRSEDIPQALSLIEAQNLFSYKEADTLKIDDGRARVLVAVDFSAYSIKACQAAFHIAKELNAKVKILHVYHNIYFPSHIPFAQNLKETPDEGLLGKARKQMLDLCCEIERKIFQGEWASVNYSYSIREGQVNEEIENFVLEYKPKLLVLGTKGKDETQTSLLGSVTADVIEAINVPVLAIPQEMDISDMKPKHIAFLTNLQSTAIESFHSLVELLKPYTDIKITLLHINRLNLKGDKWKEPELKQIRDNFSKTYPQYNIAYQLIDAPDISLAISEFVKKEQVSVICVTTRRRGLFGRIFWPSLSRKMLWKIENALLILRR